MGVARAGDEGALRAQSKGDRGWEGGGCEDRQRQKLREHSPTPLWDDGC